MLQPDLTDESSMTTAKPPARYGAMVGARAGGFALAELHHHSGPDPDASATTAGGGGNNQLSMSVGTTHTFTFDGWHELPASPIVYRQRPNGNMPREQIRKHIFILGTMKPSSINSAGMRPIRMAIHTWLGCSSPIHSACMTCMEMCRNGWKTATTIIAAPGRMPHLRLLGTAVTESFAEGPGGIMPVVYAPRAGNGWLSINPTIT